MIVVTLGTASFPFDRALLWLNALLEQNIITESVFLQHGITDASMFMGHPLVQTERTIESKQLLALVDTARLVISHAGQGSSRMLAARKTPFVLLPRLKRYAEHVDDHQLWFAQSIEPLGVQHCLSLESLEAALLEPPPPFQGTLFDGPKLVDHLLSCYPS